MANDMDCSDSEWGTTNEKAVSLLSSSLNKALEKQSSIIVNSITGPTERLAENSTANGTVHVADCGPALNSNTRGTKFKFGFNESCRKLRN